MGGTHPAPRRSGRADLRGSPASPWAIAGLALLVAAIFFADSNPAWPGVDTSLYVIPVVLTLWIGGVRATLLCGGAVIVLGAAAVVLEAGGFRSAMVTLGFVIETLAVVGATAAVALAKRIDSRVATQDRAWLALADVAPVLIRVGNDAGKITYANEAWSELLGRDAGALVGSEWSRIGGGIPRSTHGVEAEFLVTDGEGRSRWVLERVSPRPGNGQVDGGYVGFGIDVTHRHEAEQALLESRTRLAEAERAASLGHAEIVATSGAKPSWSDGVYRLLGLAPGDVEPSIETFFEFVVPEDREFLETERKRIRESGEWRETVVRIRRADGERRTLRLNVKLYAATGDRPGRYFGTLQDVTERAEMERSLVEHRNSLAKAQEVANLGSWVFEPATGRAFWSEQMTRMFGIDVSTIPRAVEDFVERVVHPDDRAEFLASWPRVLDGREPVASEYRIILANGEVRAIRAQCEYIPGSGGEPDSVVGICQDVTEMRAAESALRESEERFDLAAKGANDGIWDWPDVTRDDLWISPRYFELLGYENLEFRPCGSHFNEELVHPDDVQRNLDAVALHLANEGPYDIEIRLRTKQGYRWFQMRGQAQFGADGSPRRMAGSMQDVHARKLAEQQIEKYQAQLRSLAYAALIAAERERRRIGIELHDRTIQNLGVTSMKLAALGECESPQAGDAIVREIRALIKETIRDTRALLAELGPPVLYELGFEAAVEWLAEQVATGTSGTRFSVSSDETEKPLGEGSQVVLFQAVRELLTNVSKHARAASATVRLEREDNALRVTVADDGVGFDPAGLDAPDVEHGGFGLFSIRESLRLLGGEMQADSRPGGGTRVTLLVPLGPGEKTSEIRAAS